MDKIDNRVLQSEGAPLFGNLPPEWAAFLRGAIGAVISAVVLALIDYFSSTNVPTSMEVYVPIILVVLRTLEGIKDQHSVTASAAKLARLRADRS